MLTATVRMVVLGNAVSMTLCRAWSVAESTDAVASSINRTRDVLKNARAKQNNCLWPTENDEDVRWVSVKKIYLFKIYRLQSKSNFKWTFYLAN